MRWPWQKPPPPPPPELTFFEQLLSYANDLVAAHSDEPYYYWALATTILCALGIALFAMRMLTIVDPVEKKLLDAEARRRAYRKQVVDLTFRALKTVAMADGIFHETERELLQSVADSLTVECPDLDAIPCVHESELALRVPEAGARVRLITLMVHVALIDGHEDEREYDVVKKFAKEFAVPDASLNKLRAAVKQGQKGTKDALKQRLPGPGRLVRHASSSEILLAEQSFATVLHSLCHR